MKIQLIIIAIFFLPIFSQCQTLSETTDFLYSYYHLIPYANKTDDIEMIYSAQSENCTSNYIKTGTAQCHFATVWCHTIKSVSYYHQLEAFIGDEHYWDDWVFEIVYTVNGETKKTGLGISSDKDREYVEKYKKAILRLAILSGAKIVNEDLF